MHLHEVDPRSLVPNPWNTNAVSPENMEKLEESLKRNGWVKPALARKLEDGTFQILGGQHRVEASVSLGLDTVPVVVLENVDETKAKEIGLIDNARYGADDAIGLAELIDDLGGSMVIAEFMPFSNAELAALTTDVDLDIDDLVEGNDEPDNTPPEPTKKPVKTHQMMRYKVPIDDADDVSDTILAVMQDQGFDEADSLTNAGDALVWIVRDWMQLRSKSE